MPQWLGQCLWQSGQPILGASASLKYPWHAMSLTVAQPWRRCVPAWRCPRVAAANRRVSPVYYLQQCRDCRLRRQERCARRPQDCEILRLARLNAVICGTFVSWLGLTLRFGMRSDCSECKSSTLNKRAVREEQSKDHRICGARHCAHKHEHARQCDNRRTHLPVNCA